MERCRLWLLQVQARQLGLRGGELARAILLMRRAISLRKLGHSPLVCSCTPSVVTQSSRFLLSTDCRMDIFVIGVAWQSSMCAV